MQVENRSDETVPQGDITPDDVTVPQEGVPSDPGAFAHPSTAIRPGLSPVQEVAMQRLIAGSSIQQAARAAHVDRRTLSRWLHNDPYFAAAFAAWQREVVASGRARVLAMTDIALDAVQNAILQGDGRVALQVRGCVSAYRPRDGPIFASRQGASPKRLKPSESLRARDAEAGRKAGRLRWAGDGPAASLSRLNDS